MYRVIWRRAVLDDLARIYTAVFEARGDTAAVTAAVDRFDRLLLKTPGELGESRDRYERVFVISPLTFTFEVFDDEQMVVVLDLVYRPSRPRA